MDKKIYTFLYTEEELAKLRALLNKAEVDTDVEEDNNLKGKPEVTPTPVHVDIQLIDDLGYVIPLHSVISMLSCYLTPNINVQETTIDFINALLNTVVNKTREC
jgi:hypothetical protein